MADMTLLPTKRFPTCYCVVLTISREIGPISHKLGRQGQWGERTAHDYSLDQRHTQGWNWHLLGPHHHQMNRVTTEPKEPVTQVAPEFLSLENNLVTHDFLWSTSSFAAAALNSLRNLTSWRRVSSCISNSQMPLISPGWLAQAVRERC